MKKWFFFTICLFFSFTFFITPIRAASPYTIDDEYIRITANENGSLDVEETITVTRNAAGNFKLSIPLRYTIDPDGDGSKEEYVYGISNISVEDYEYTSKHTSDEVNVTIKDKSKSGSTKYVVRYHVRLKDFGLDEKQALYYAVIANQHEATIKNLTFSIQMPFQVNGMCQVFSGEDQNISAKANCSAIGKTIQGSINQELKTNEGLMIRADLHEAYFSYSNPFPKTFFASLISMIIAICVYVYYFVKNKENRQGKHQKDGVNYLPPEHIDAWFCGYIMDGIVEDNDIVTLIISFAQRGYIEIRDEFQTISLHIVRELPANAPAYEKLLFDTLFETYNYVTVDELQAKDLRHIFQQIKSEIYHIFSKNKRQLYTSQVKEKLYYGVMISAIPSFLIAFAGYYDETGRIISSLLPSLIIYLISLVAMLPWVYIAHKKHTTQSKKIKMIQYLLYAFDIIIGCGIYYHLGVLHVPMAFLMITLICMIMILIILVIIDHKTKLGYRLSSQLLALQDFIRHAQSRELIYLYQNNRNYFSYILPYAYALGVSDIWAKKFQLIDVQQPLWYYTGKNTSSTIYWMGYFQRAIQRIEKSIVPTVAGKKKKKHYKLKRFTKKKK